MHSAIHSGNAMSRTTGSPISASDTGVAAHMRNFARCLATSRMSRSDSSRARIMLAKMPCRGHCGWTSSGSWQRQPAPSAPIEPGGNSGPRGNSGGPTARPRLQQLVIPHGVVLAQPALQRRDRVPFLAARVPADPQLDNRSGRRPAPRAKSPSTRSTRSLVKVLECRHNLFHLPPGRHNAREPRMLLEVGQCPGISQAI